MTIELTVLISVATAVVGALLGISTFIRNDKKEHSESIKEKAVVSTKLDNISMGVQDIQVQVRSTEKRLEDINEKVIRIEESAKSAHKRIDKLDEKGVCH